MVSCGPSASVDVQTTLLDPDESYKAASERCMLLLTGADIARWPAPFDHHGHRSNVRARADITLTLVGRWAFGHTRSLKKGELSTPVAH